MSPIPLLRAKYNAAQIHDLVAAGKTFDKSGSYPINDVEDLDSAIKAVGMGGADHNAIRAYIVKRATAMNATHQIPKTWNSDGSLK